MFNLKDWSLKAKLSTFIPLGLIIFIVLLTAVFSKSEATSHYLHFPKTAINIQNDEGNKINMKVRKGEDKVDLTGIAPSVIKNGLPLYLATPYPASDGHRVGKLPISIDVALFNDKGKLIKIYNVPEMTSKDCNPETEYQYVIMAHDGYFNEKDISENKYSELQVDTIDKTG